MKVDTVLQKARSSNVLVNTDIKINEKDPVCQLREIFGKIVWDTKVVVGVHNKCLFKVSTVVNGNKFDCTGTTLEMAKKSCALAALNQFSKNKKSFLNNFKQINDKEAIVAQKTGFSVKNRSDKQLRTLKNITNLQINSNLLTGRMTCNLKTLNLKAKCKSLATKSTGNQSNPSAKFEDSESSQGNEVISNEEIVLPVASEEIKDNSIVDKGNVLNLMCNEENAIALLGRNDKESGDRFIPLVNSNLPTVIEEIDDDCIIVDQKIFTNLPSCSRSSGNAFGNYSKLTIYGLQSKTDSIMKAKTLNETNSLSELCSITSNKLNAFELTKSCTNTDMTNVQTIELKVSVQSFAKNPISGANLLPNQVKNLKERLKRSREESAEVIELPPAKRRSTDINFSKYENPIECLKKLQLNLNFSLVAETGIIHEPYFLVSAMVANRNFYGHGKTRHLAENDAAIKILSFMEKSENNKMNIEPSSPLSSNQKCQQVVLHNKFNNEICSSLLLPSQYADIVEAKVMHAFDNLMSMQGNYSNYKVLAGIIMTYNMDFYNSTVVSIATGTKCVNGGNICCSGSVLNDSHAEIIAKRGLVKFLFTQLRNHCRFDTMENSVFERTSMGYRLKSLVHFHLYINTAPCGDARVFNFNHNLRFNNSFETSFNSLQYGQLRTKVEGELGTTPIGSRFYPQTWDGVLLGERLQTMSCSDKIALWNVVGIQGALLSQFVEPIYLHSITLGRLFDAQHMYRAVCGRIQDTLGHLPQSYRLNRPLLGQTSKPLRRCTKRVPSFGINWTLGDYDIEIISLPTGRSIYNQTSFLSKQAFFFKYVFLRKNLPNLGSASVSNNYAEAKQNAQDYQRAKREVFEAFHRANLGNWVKKPKEQNEFAMNFY